MSLPAPIQKARDPHEIVVWTGQPYTPQNLLDYRGWHRVIGIAFIAMAITMTFVSWSNRTAIDGTAAIGVLILVVTPLIFGFGFWFGLSWLQRDARQKTHYAVTNKRVLVVNKHGSQTHTLRSDADIQHKVGKAGIDKIQFNQARDVHRTADLEKRRVTPLAKAFLLSHDNAVAAFAALQDLRGSAHD